MVRHGTQKKRRSGRKVTRKPQLAWGKRQKNAVRDPVMREQWNSNESIESNFSKAGIVSEVNKISSIRKENSVSKAFEGFVDLPKELQKNPDTNHHQRGKMSEFDQEYAVKLIRKHGENYHRMQMDTKTNTRQMNSNQAKKFCEQYLMLKGDKILVPL
jgi:hypothetical protein